MYTRAFRELAIATEDTTLINIDPGVVNTKMLIAGWGKIGMDVENATDTFRLATED